MRKESLSKTNETRIVFFFNNISHAYRCLGRAPSEFLSGVAIIVVDEFSDNTSFKMAMEMEVKGVVFFYVGRSSSMLLYLRCIHSNLRYFETAEGYTPYLRERTKKSLGKLTRLVSLLVTRLRLGSRISHQAHNPMVNFCKKYGGTVIFTKIQGSDYPDMTQIAAAKILNEKRWASLYYMPMSWDYLTTKGVIQVEDIQLLLWNKRILEDALMFHNYDRKLIHIIGSPNFWFISKNLSQRKNSEFNNRSKEQQDVLFIGSSRQISPNEYELVEALAENIGGGFQLHYRLHPTRYKDLQLVKQRLKSARVTLVEAAETVAREDEINIASRFVAVLGINSTMMFEAFIGGGLVIPVLHRSVDNRMVHCKDVYACFSVHLDLDSDQLFTEALEMAQKEQAKTVSEVSEYFVPFGNPYARLENITTGRRTS